MLFHIKIFWFPGIIANRYLLQPLKGVPLVPVISHLVKMLFPHIIGNRDLLTATLPRELRFQRYGALCSLRTALFQLFPYYGFLNMLPKLPQAKHKEEATGYPAGFIP